ncbi:uncharacterized protein LOC125663999 [Ostrea edulis]|uniref:uncharacterized protein LOC125663999 n=1 Tax=Ostrea edulis TaxID=37623 RepID=UPI0024AFAB01|nr:uncharacterized protein LOC125663999 [Ostrea edulis]
MHSNYCDIPSDHEPDHGNETTNVMKTKDAGTLCDPDPLSKENEKLQEELRETKRDLQRERWGVHRIADNDSLTKFYTSLPTFAMFLWLFSYLKDKCERMTYWTGESHTLPGTDRTRARRSHLQPIDQLLAVLMRNRLGLFVQDIAERFCIAPSTFSKYYTTWLCLLHKELKFLNPFPAKDVVQRTMPSQFKKIPNTRIIIDCTEIFIQKSSSLTNQSLTFSNYKNHNTAKSLVGITPSGIISFVSEGWGGKVSDRQITEESGLLDLLEPGDSVMADKGFTITDLLKQRGCYLNIPPFLRNDHQFAVEDVYNTQEIAQLRIHVERSIGRVKNFHIFDGVLPLSMIPLVSKLFQVCCWLSNLDVPLVEDK